MRDLRTCEACNASAKARVYRARNRNKERRRIARALHSLEAAGDTALSKYDHSEAAIHYQEALSAELPLIDDDRISEKLVRAIFYTSRPDLARGWIERSIARHSALGLSTEGLAIQFMMPRQYWLEAKTPLSIALIGQIRKHHGERATVETQAQLEALSANYLTLLGRYDEAGAHAVPLTAVHANSRARVILANQRAMIDAAHGDAEGALVGFDSAVEAAKALEDGYLLTIVWDDYANWSTVLGKLETARTCRERALFVAREQHIAWRVPYLSLRYASLLIVMGDYTVAKELLAEAITHSIETPILRILAATISAQLAYAMGNAVLESQRLDRDALEAAFASSEPGWIGPIAAAYARILEQNNAVDEARSIVSRAVSAINSADHAEELLALTARYGTRAEAKRAQDILRRRVHLPNGHVAAAFSRLWDAYDALRHRSATSARTIGTEAARHFRAIGWMHQEREAYKLAEPSRRVDAERARAPIAALGDFRPALSARELQVAELVLRGQTNRAIAKALSISEHTVESHMTSIFNRLGLRSRWQLQDLMK
ncbi:MAG TPA: LuxR C-terminal-related transcriptional regulator [Candidatus Baltobacteraceae bacterium]|jgi:ATP/maltotriose-dependent transcriptional regulator MalT